MIHIIIAKLFIGIVLTGKWKITIEKKLGPSKIWLRGREGIFLNELIMKMISFNNLITLILIARKELLGIITTINKKIVSVLIKDR